MTKEQRKELLSLWRDRIKDRAGNKCEKCQSVKGLQGHHIIPRTNFNLIFDLENGVLLCKHCHLFWAHKDALGFTEWIKTKRDLNYLESRRHGQSNNDYNLMKIYLKQNKA